MKEKVQKAKKSQEWEHIFTEEKYKKWDDIIKWYENLKKQKKETWIFRGQENSAWGLETSLERSMRSYWGDEKNNNIQEFESGLLRRFKRELPNHHRNIPSEENLVEWFALMQHYGAPTRFLDWTYSFYVALYFAIENSKSECAVWAIDKRWISKRFRSLIPPALEKRIDKDRNVKAYKTFKKLIKRDLVFPINPYKFNDRLVIQQGNFLCPGNITKTFKENLLALESGNDFLRDHLFKITIKGDDQERRNIIRNLHRMNMNRATLFPGLDGFAQSLKTLLVFEDIPQPDPKYNTIHKSIAKNRL